MDDKNFEKLEEVFLSLMKKSISKWLESTENKISGSQYYVLKMLFEDGPQKMSDLASNLNITTSAVTSLSDKLLQQFYIERLRSDSDRRIVRLSITDKGIEIYKSITKKRHENLKKIHNNLSDEEVDFLVKIYLKMLDNFS